MSLLQDAVLNDLRHHSTFDLSFTNTFSFDPGPVAPVLCQEIFPGDFVRVNDSTSITTAPLKSPLKGVFEQEIAYFFVPLRLYQQLFDTNRQTFSASAPFPTCFRPGIVFSDNPGINDGESSSSAGGVVPANFASAPGSLVEFMNTYPAYTLNGYAVVNAANDTSSGFPRFPDMVMNEFKFISYYDIIRQYFSDPQVPYVPVIGPSIAPVEPSSAFDYDLADRAMSACQIPGYTTIPLGFLDDFIQNLVALSACGSPTGAKFNVVVHAGTPDARQIDYYDLGVSEYFSVFTPNYFSAADVWFNLAHDKSYRFVPPCPWGFSRSLYSGNQGATSAQRMNYSASGLFDSNSFDLFATWNIPYGGLCLRTLRPDLFTAFFKEANYNDLEKSVTINTLDDMPGGSSITFNQIRIGSHLQAYNDRLFMSDGRYGGFVESEWCVKTDKRLCIPEILGVHSGYIDFRTVVSSSTAVPETTEAGQSVDNGLGQLGGQGYGHMSGKPITFSASEHGLLIAVYSIKPLISYSGRYDWYDDNLSLDDLYSPALDNIGFQPLPFKWMSSSTPRVVREDGVHYPISQMASFQNFLFGERQQAYGYQPAWNQLTTRVDETHGEFTVNGDLNYWVLNRDVWSGFKQAWLDSSDNGALDLMNLCSAPFVWPFQYEYPFVLQDYDVRTSATQASSNPANRLAVAGVAGNFHPQITFNMRIKRKKSKSIQPTLA